MVLNKNKAFFLEEKLYKFPIMMRRTFFVFKIKEEKIYYLYIINQVILLINSSFLNKILFLKKKLGRIRFIKKL